MLVKKQLPFYLIFGIPLVLLLTCLFLTTRLPFESQPFIFSNAIIADLLLTIPLVYYLLIRKTAIPKLTIVPVFVLGILLASKFIPVENQQYLQIIITYVFPLVELGVFIFLTINLYKLIKEFRRNKLRYQDFYDNLKQSASTILPNKISQLFATEISVLFYSFIHWKKESLSINEYSYHKNSGSVGLFLGLLLIITIELSVLHVLLAKWSETFAWVLTALSIYSAIQIIGFLKSIMKRPIILKGESLILRYGILSETIVSLHDIKKVVLSSKELEEGSDVVFLSPLGKLESHNIIIQLKNTNIVNRLYGLRKNYTSIAFYVDNPENFFFQLEENRKAL
ncbi:hypothetical protein [Pseudofulvibacter geojedonensis]|uniref:Uncharacterized protein n=1 Tax=Pseudofulvibacter geojedonensis TaxID=1123758 RepID=A0ABW3I2X1_9FLAO